MALFWENLEVSPLWLQRFTANDEQKENSLIEEKNIQDVTEFLDNIWKTDSS